SSGTTTFYLKSDDGSKLYINNQLVIDNDGNHGTVEKSATISLAAGWYPIEVQYYDKSGGEALGLDWKVGSGSRQSIQSLSPSKLSYFKGGILTANPLAAPQTPGNPSPSSIAKTLEPDPVVNATTNKIKVKLTWSQSNPTNIISYEIYRLKTATATFPTGIAYTKIAEIPFVLNSYFYRDSVDLTNPDGSGFLEPGKYYWYKVRAKSATSFSGYWEPGSRQIPTTINNINLPSIPSSVAATALSNSVVRLTWVNSSTNLSGIEVWRSSAIDGIFNLVGKTKLNAASFNDSTCLAKTTYYYKLRSFNARGKSNFSTVVSTTSLNIPNIPANLVALSLGSNHIALSWTVTDDQALGFKIYRATSVNGTYEKVDSIANPLLVSYQDQSLSAATTYYYKIKAYNRNDDNTQNESGFSVVASATTAQSLTVDAGDWHLPIVPGTFASTFSNKKSNTVNKVKLKTALESNTDFLNMMHIDSTVNTPVSFSFQMPAISEFPNGAMLIYNIGYSKTITQFLGGGVTLNTNDSTTIVDGSDLLQNLQLKVYVSSVSNFATKDSLPSSLTWKSQRNYDLQKISLPTTFINTAGSTVALGGKYIKVELTVKSTVNTSNQSLWMSEIGLYKFLGAGVRHNYVVLLGASFEEQLPGMGLTMFRKKLSTYPELKDKGKNLVIFNLAVSGTATGNLADSLEGYLNKHPNASYVFVHQGGNNI
ncbi:MAG TPA: PA14 domain-containing protein, partial [Cytophagales bacterium]|nr:PA14 domain-containing protein [Cytophagales bacterium]